MFFRTNEPLWVIYQVNQNLILQPENYEDVFPRIDLFNGDKTNTESSKDSLTLRIEATHLLDMHASKFNKHL